jgi:broad specificity phosphatase PhoE
LIEVLLIRHAQSEANINAHLVGGRTETTPLSPLGQQQAQQLGSLLYSNAKKPTKIIASPAVRAQQTARIVMAEFVDMPAIETVHEVHEMSQGTFEGQPREQVYTAKARQRMEVSGKAFKLDCPEAESMDDVAKRMNTFITQTVQQAQAGDMVFIFTHGVAISCYVSHVLNLNHEETFQLTRRLPNASVTKLLFTNSEYHPEIVYVGKTA